MNINEAVYVKIGSGKTIHRTYATYSNGERKVIGTECGQGNGKVDKMTPAEGPSTCKRCNWR